MTLKTLAAPVFFAAFLFSAAGASFGAQDFSQKTIRWKGDLEKNGCSVAKADGTPLPPLKLSESVCAYLSVVASNLNRITNPDSIFWPKGVSLPAGQTKNGTDDYIVTQQWLKETIESRLNSDSDDHGLQSSAFDSSKAQERRGQVAAQGQAQMSGVSDLSSNLNRFDNGVRQGEDSAVVAEARRGQELSQGGGLDNNSNLELMLGQNPQVRALSAAVRQRQSSEPSPLGTAGWVGGLFSGAGLFALGLSMARGAGTKQARLPSSVGAVRD